LTVTDWTEIRRPTNDHQRNRFSPEVFHIGGAGIIEETSDESKREVPDSNGINRTETVFAEGFIENFGIYFLK